MEISSSHKKQRLLNVFLRYFQSSRGTVLQLQRSKCNVRSSSWLKINMQAQHGVFRTQLMVSHRSGLCFCCLRGVFAFHNSHVKVTLLWSLKWTQGTACLLCDTYMMYHCMPHPWLGSNSVPHTRALTPYHSCTCTEGWWTYISYSAVKIHLLCP